MKFLLGVFLMCLSVLLAAGAQAASLDEEVQKLARGWDHAAFEISGQDEQLAALDSLEAQAAALAGQYPKDIEPLAWKAIILSTKANAAEGMKALDFAGAARKQLEKVAAINPDPLGDGAIYAMLGAIYDGVPGFPIGFGDKGKARKYLQKALEQHPTGADANYFYGVYLAGQKRYKEANQVLRTALRAPARPGREIADKGRRADISEELKAIEGKLAQQ